MKKWYQKLSHPWAKSTAGFTLVELIVVIAIMGVLGGVGTVGYGQYMKNSQKKADQALVGNVIRAIEMGTNSTMFMGDNSFVKGNTTFPVGVVVLSTEKGGEVASTSSTVQNTTSECVMDTITVVTDYTIKGYDNGQGILDKVGQLLGLTAPAHIDEYTIKGTKDITYCATHSNKPPQKTVATKVKQVNKVIVKYYDKETTGTYYFEDDCKGMYALATDHVEGGTVTSSNIVKDQNAVNRVSFENDSHIKSALQAAFGEDLSGLTLQYNGWGSAEDGGHTYATLLTYTEGMINDIKETGQTLINLENTLGNAINFDNYLAKDYANTADMMDSYANFLATSYTDRGVWADKWVAAASENNDRSTFGLRGTLDYIYATRVAYNSAFASYCDANGANPDYLSVIEDYSQKDSSYGLIDVPCVVNTFAFNDENTEENNVPLKQKFKDAGDSDGTVFEQYKNLYEQYKDSESCRKNGEVFYDTMSTVAQTGSEAFKSGNADNYFKYYENMMQEMAAYYNLMDNYTGDGIMILVTVENGVVKCDVSPSAANPRNG